MQPTAPYPSCLIIDPYPAVLALPAYTSPPPLPTRPLNSSALSPTPPQVKVAEHVLTGHKVAIKILNRRKIQQMEMDEKGEQLSDPWVWLDAVVGPGRGCASPMGCVRCLYKAIGQRGPLGRDLLLLGVLLCCSAGSRVACCVRVCVGGAWGRKSEGRGRGVMSN